MQEQVNKTRKFHRKHGFSLDKDLTSFKSDDNMTRYLKALAVELLTHAKDIEGMMPNEHDPRLARTQLMVEELGETILGLANCNEVETLDGLSDLVFVTIGTALAFGLPIVEGLDEVCDSNLTKDPRDKTDPRLRRKGPDYVPPNMARVISWHRGLDVRAERTSCVEGGQTYMTTIHIELDFHKELNSYWVHITKGGITGYESVEVSRVKEMTDGWSACNGTKDKWDALFLPAESMKEIQEWLEQ